MRTLKLAVIGKDVSQSTSPEMHSFIAERMGNVIDYVKLSVPEDEFLSRAESLFGKFDGFNVTIPYKLSIIPYLSSLDGDAGVFGAVNTVRTSDRTGYNTDGLGFALMLKNGGVEVGGKRALVLGAGGAGRSVAKKLLDGGADVFIYDNRPESALGVAREFAGVTALERIPEESYYLIVNATGVGMHKTVGVSPVGAELIALCEAAVDLIYVPRESEFLRIARSLGKKVINGEAMLFYQAYFAECIYFGRAADDSEAKRLFGEYTEERK